VDKINLDSDANTMMRNTGRFERKTFCAKGTAVVPREQKNSNALIQSKKELAF
jgi:hypothetical protein